VYAARAKLAEAADAAFGENRIAFAAWAVTALVAATLLAGLAAFIVDPSTPRLSVLPGSGFFSHHSCYTAYHEGARFAGSAEPNLYAPEPAHRGPRAIDGFNVDDYYYPPTFLLLPELVRLVARDFLHERMVWYALGFFSVAAAMLLAARFIGERAGRIAALLAVVVFLAIPARLALQVGNFQAIAVAWSVLAMIAFERKRPAVGGALLAFTMLGKFYPGILLAYLVGARRWRDVAWTLGWCVAYALLVLLRWGPKPFDAFVHYTLPRLASGEAFGMLRTFPWTVTINQSIYGIVLKLRMMGLSWASFEMASVVSWLYTLAIVVGAMLVGRLQLSRAATVRVWLAFVGLAALRSPFLPIGYALFAPLWLLTLVACSLPGRKRLAGAALLALGWGALGVVLPPEGFAGHAEVALVVGTLPQLVTLILYGGVVMSAARDSRREGPGRAGASLATNGAV